MKRFKFFTVALTLIMGMSFTSCLDDDDDDDDSTVQVTTMAKVCYASGYYFEMSDGATITPSTTSISEFMSAYDMSSIRNHLIRLTFTYTASSITDENSTNVSNATIVSIVDLMDTVEVVYYEGAPNDSIEDAPILSLGNSSITPFLFDDENIVLPINYYISDNYHSFTLVYYYDDDNTSDSVIDLYLRHNTNGDNANTSSYTAYDQYYNYGGYYYYGYVWKFYLHAFNLSEVYDTLSTTATAARIHYKQNTSVIVLDDEGTTEETYVLSLQD